MQQNQQYVQQTSQIATNVPMFSPFAYQQPSASIPLNSQQPTTTTHFQNPVNFFNTSTTPAGSTGVVQYTDPNIINNNQIHLNQQTAKVITTSTPINSPYVYQQIQQQQQQSSHDDPQQQKIQYDLGETARNNNTPPQISLPNSQVNQQQQPIANVLSYSPSSFAFQHHQLSQQQSIDDLPPPPPLQTHFTALTNVPVMPTIDRHNYLVTGQPFQEPSISFNHHHHQPQSIQEQVFSENLPPPRLSREDYRVVGEPESIGQQTLANRNDDVLPPGLNRLVTGTETNAQSSYMNYQRQADGEVSQPSSLISIRPTSTLSFNQQQQMQQNNNNNVENEQSFDISDRNLYLVAGESNANNNQRVIPGVESDSSNNNSSNAPLSVINPLQNLHIEDDEDFVNISVTTQQRNVDGDGMEEQQQILQRQQQQLSIDNEQREEDIEGANDNSIGNGANFAPPPMMPQSINAHERMLIPAASALNEPQESDIREDIEGANDYSFDLPPMMPQPSSSSSFHQQQQQSSEIQDEKRKSIDGSIKKPQKSENTMSSEDSELRELEKNTTRSKVRHSKKYDDSNDSESEDGAKARDKYEDRYKRSSREKSSREENEKYKRRDKERRSGGGNGRSKRNDDTDGSRYGESRRRTDDEDEDIARRNRRRDRGRKDEEVDDGEEKERKREKHRDPRRSEDFFLLFIY